MIFTIYYIFSGDEGLQYVDVKSPLIKR